MNKLLTCVYIEDWCGDEGVTVNTRRMKSPSKRVQASFHDATWMGGVI